MAGSILTRTLASLFWCDRGDSLYQKRQNQTPANQTPQPANRKQGLDKNTIFFAAAASTMQVSEGHALDRKCFWGWGWWDGGETGWVNSWLLGACAPFIPWQVKTLSLICSCPSWPWPHGPPWTFIDFFLFYLRLWSWELNDCGFQHALLAEKHGARDQQTFFLQRAR